MTKALADEPFEVVAARIEPETVSRAWGELVLAPIASAWLAPLEVTANALEQMRQTGPPAIRRS